VHKHSNHDFVDLIILDSELVGHVGSGVTQEPAELLQSTSLLFLRSGLRRGDFSFPVHSLFVVSTGSGRRLESTPSVTILVVVGAAESFSDHLGSEEKVVIVYDD
jgi:hypothetical protein